MRRKNFKLLFIQFFTVLFFATIHGQDRNDMWIRTNDGDIESRVKAARNEHPDTYRLYFMNLGSLKDRLIQSPKRNSYSKRSTTILKFPMANGQVEQFEVFEASIMSNDLQARHPEIRTYYGKGLENRDLKIRFSVTNQGFHGMIFNGQKETQFIDTYSKDKETYIVYSKKDITKDHEFVCKFSEVNEVIEKANPTISSKELNANDGLLRKFRLAVATTGEYAQFHLSDQGISSEATDEEKKEAVLSAIVVAITRVNAIFERDLGITMELITENDRIIFLDPEGDNLTNNSGSELIDEIQDKIDGEIGSSNYDIGHVFSTGGGGVAALRTPCTNSKAKGVTGLPAPIGDPFYIDYVSHEMGHQFGATHSYNTEDPDCSDEKNNSTSVEPGSGSTIMSYAGLCPPDNVQSNSDAYFHIVSIRQIMDNVLNGNSTCATTTDTGNNPPEITALENYTIPVSTPFFLDAQANDIDGDNLTYTWEQLDTELAEYPLVSTNLMGPAFRSVSPSSSSKRFFPELNTVLAGGLLNAWEVLPSVGRTMKFAVTVRDNNELVGQTASEETVITFDENSGPFKITSHSEAQTWDSGTVQTVEWDVAMTNEAPINCSFVDILLSTDGGQTFDIVLASNVDNDGSHNIVVPNATVAAARIMVVASNNIFFAVNSIDIAIQSSEFVMDFTSNMVDVCLPNNAVFSFTYRTYLGFAEETVFSATGLPGSAVATFDPAIAVNDGTTVTMTISNLASGNIGVHDIDVTGTSVSTTKNTTAVLGVYDPNQEPPVLVFPENQATHVLTPYALRWDKGNNEQQYTVQISLANDFQAIYEEADVLTNYYVPESLTFNTSYFWRVKSENTCGTSSYSDVFEFTTANEVCNEFQSIEIPLNIPDADANGVKSVLTITNNQLITDINVRVNITHPWVEDLTLTLISPSGRSVILASQNGGSGDDYDNTVFDSESTDAISSGIAPFNGIYAPLGDFSNLYGEESYGNWILKLVDAGPEDVGILNSWNIEICGVDIIGNDDDKDGVINEEDLCAFTPLGSAVDANGCSTFNLSESNFTIEFTGESCTGQNDASIRIDSEEIGTYYTIINGTKHEFTNVLTLNNMEPGMVSFCVKVYGEPVEQCFNVDIPGGVGVRGMAEIDDGIIRVVIEEGTAPFSIFINNELLMETSLEVFELPVKHGDLVEVKTAKSCEGVFSKNVLIDNIFLVYPNPTHGPLDIRVTTEQDIIDFQIYSIQGQLVATRSCRVENGLAKLDIKELSTGLYLIKSSLEGFNTVKIIKE